MPVQVELVASKPIALTTEYLSLLKSRHSASINPQVEGYITKIFVKSGDRVTAGSPLLQIDPLKQEATVSSQEASRLAQESNVNLARINLDRAKKLSDAGVIAKSDLDNAQTTYDTAVAQLKSLEQQVQQQQVELHYYKVSAPMDGIVGDIPVHLGDRVTVATLLTTVDEPGALEAYIYVPAARAHDLRLGLPVHLLDEAGQSSDGFADHIYFSAGGFRHPDGAGEGRDTEFQGKPADRAAGARASGLEHGAGSGGAGAGGDPHQRSVLCVRCLQGSQGHFRAPACGEGGRHRRQ